MWPKKLAYLTKLPKVNNRPIGKNSLNLVALFATAKSA
jgi:hypothetical protein